jgi:WD40 repeat protein
MEMTVPVTAHSSCLGSKATPLASISLAVLLALIPSSLHRAPTRFAPDDSGEPLLTLETAHSDQVTALAFTADGRWLASASRDRSIKIWDVAAGRVTATLLGHTKEITSLAFNPDGRILASSGHDGTVRLWRSETQWEGEILAGTGTSIYSITFSRDGQSVLYGDLSGAITARDVSSGAKLFRLRAHGVVQSVTISPDGRLLASATESVTAEQENSVVVWDLLTRKEVYRQSDYTKPVTRAVFSPDGRFLASAGYGDPFRILDAKTGAVLSRIDSDIAGFLDFTSDSGLVTSDVGAVNLWRSWDESTKSQLRIYLGPTSAFSPAARILASADILSGGIHLWKLPDKNELPLASQPMDRVAAIAVSPDGRQLAAAASRQIRVWDLSTGSFRVLDLELSNEISNIKFSPDGGTIATWSYSNSKTFTVWDFRSGKKLFDAAGHTGAINSVVFRPDGRVLASASEDHTIRTWDTTSGGPLRTIQAHPLQVQSLAYSPDGTRLFSTGVDVRYGDMDDRNSSSLKVWDPVSGQELKQFSNNELEPLGDHLLLASNQRLVSIHFRDVWVQEPDTGRVLRQLKTGASPLTSIAISPDAKWIATGDDTGLVRIWDFSSGYEIHSLKGHTSEIKSLAFAPDRTWLVSAANDGTIRLWDPIKGIGIANFASFSSGRDWISLSKDRKFAGSPGGEAQVVLSQRAKAELQLSSFRDPAALPALLGTLAHWDRTNQPGTARPQVLLTAPTGMDLANATGSSLMLRVHVSAVQTEADAPSAAEINEVQLLRNGQLIRTWAGDLRLTSKGEADLYERVPVEASATKYAAVATTTSGVKSIVSELSISSNQVTPELALQEGHVGLVNRVLFSPKDALIASGGHDGAVNLWDADSGRQIRPLLGHTGAIMALAFSPDGAWLASGSSDSTVILWQIATGHHVRTLSNRDGAILSLAINAKRPVLAAGRQDFAIDLWDFSSGRAIRTLIGHRGPVTCLAFSSDGKLLASASLDQTVRIWDAASGELLKVLAPHAQGVAAISFSPDSQTLVSGEQFGTIRFWDTSTGKQIRSLERASEFDSSVPKDKMPFLLDALVYSPDGARIATSDGFFLDRGLATWITAEDVRGSIKVFDALSGEQLREFKENVGIALNGLSYSPDGTRLAWGDNNGRIRILKTREVSEPITYTAHSDSGSLIAISTDSQQLAIVGNKIHLWNLQNGRPPELITNDAFGTRRSDAPPSETTIRALCTFVSKAKGAAKQASWNLSSPDIAYSPDGRWLALARKETYDVALYDTTTLKLSQALGGIEQSEPLQGVKFSSDGKFLLTVGSHYSSLLLLWDVHSGQQLRTVETGLSNIATAIFFPNKHSVAVASEDGISIWDICNGKRENLIFKGSGPVSSLAFSPRGDLLASSGPDGQIRIWDMETASVVRTLSGDPRSAASLLFVQPTGQQGIGPLTLISSTYSSTKLWDPIAGQPLATLVSPGDESDWLVTTPDGLFDGTAGALRNVSWRIADNNQTSSLDLFFEDFFHPGLLEELLSGERPKAQVDISTALQVPGLHQMLREGLAHVEDRAGQVIVCFQQKPGVAVNTSPIDQRAVFPSVSGYRPGPNANCPVEKPLLGNAGNVPARVRQLQEWKAAKLTTPWDGQHSETAGSTLHVFTVGIGQYKEKAAFPSLPYATPSARQIEAFFHEQETSSHTPYKAVRLWAGLYDSEATRENIRARLSEMIKEVSPDDVVFLYFAGHGIAPIGEEMFYFLPADAQDANLRDSAVSTAMMADVLRSLPARRIVLIVDSCQSGGAIDVLDRITGIKVQAALRSPEPERGVGVHLIAATLPLSYAIGSGSTADSALAQAILSAFKEGSGPLTANQLATYIRQRLPVISERAIPGFRQVPLVDSVGLDFPVALR